MAGDVTDELMYEQLRAIRGENARTHERLDRIEGELRVFHGHVAALVQSDLLRRSEMASLTFRVERIERRLDLHDPSL